MNRRGLGEGVTSLTSISNSLLLTVRPKGSTKKPVRRVTGTLASNSVVVKLKFTQRLLQLLLLLLTETENWSGQEGCARLNSELDFELE